MSLGKIKDYTPNFNLIIPRFDIATWHDYMESNFRSIDALFFNMFGINQYRGEWQNSTTYQVGDVLFIGDPNSQYTGRLVKVLVVHTTTANDSFDIYYAHNPINYDLFMDAAAAEQAAKLARDWAIKTDGKVQGLDYSSKYYANLITPISSEIVNVSNISNEVVNVSNISTNIKNVDAISAKIVAVSSKLNEITINSNNISSININSNNINNINTNATNINAINTNAANISVIQNAYSNAQSALNSKNKAQEWATKMNGLVDNIDYSAKYYANQSQTSAELSAQYANDKINQTHITNCITEIPQDIKLELNNGTLTLKAGSKVYVPKGVGVFYVATISSDKTYTYTAENSTRLLMYDQDEYYLYSAQIGNCYSGSSAPTNTSTTAYWYDTTNNLIKKTTNGGSTWTANVGTLPLAVISVSDGQITSIDQVFNGFGYIGSSVFALPGVKGLIPNGRNADGTLNNILTTPATTVRTSTAVSGNTGRKTMTINSIGTIDRPSGLEYNERENRNYNFGSPSNQCICGYFTVGSDYKITDFVVKTAFHAVDYNDLNALTSQIVNISSTLSTKANDADVVHKSGNEIINGEKTFQTNILYKKSTQDFTTTPAQPHYTEIRNVDKNNFEIGQFRVWKDTDGANVIDLLGRYQNNSVNFYGATLGIKSYSDGRSFPYASTPNISSNGTNIATTAYVNTKFQVVSTLPANPDSNVYYFIPE